MELPIKVGISPTLGIRGLIAARDIRKGEVIERCPVVFIDSRQTDLVQQTVFGKFWFEWNKRTICMPLGYGGLYNHSYRPNAKYHWDYRNRRIVFSALKGIRKGEELCVNYNGEPDDDSEVDAHHVDRARTAESL
jgi:hypothetical protein